MRGKATPTPQERKSKPVTEGYLDRTALHYLGRFNSSAANLRRVLERKVRRRNEDGAAPSAEQLGWIDSIAEKCVKYGYVDDASYAKQRFASLVRKGKPLRMISQDLNYKGVPEEIISELIAAAENDPDQDCDLAAAAAYVKRRRFGPYRRENAPEDKAEKEAAAMMRAGFPYSLVRRLLGSSEDEIFNLLP